MSFGMRYSIWYKGGEDYFLQDEHALNKKSKTVIAHVHVHVHFLCQLHIRTEMETRVNTHSWYILCYVNYFEPYPSSFLFTLKPVDETPSVAKFQIYLSSGLLVF